MKKRKKILIVDDSTALAQSLGDILFMEGYEISIANNPSHVVDIISKFGPHLVITDLIMPDINGFELTRTLRGSEAWRNVPIIIMTADMDIENEMIARSAGANLLLHKPFDHNELVASIEKLTT